MSHLSNLRVSSRPRQNIRSPSSARPSEVLYVAVVLLLVLAPTEAYFMKCKHFCSMLTKDELKQLWCIYDMCRSEKLGRHIVRYAKRDFGREEPDIALPVGLSDLLLDGDYSALKDLSHGRKQRFSVAPGNALFRSVEDGLPGKDKRDLEYWDGPAPADINA